MADGLIPAERGNSGLLNGAPIDRPYASAMPELHPLERPIAAVRRYKWLIVAFVIVATAIGVVGTRFVKPQYEVRATVWIESETPQGNERTGPIRSGELLSSTAWIELFRSFRIVDQVVRDLALFVHPENTDDAPLFSGFALADRFLPGRYDLSVDRAKKTWTLQNSLGIQIGAGTAADSVGRNAGFRWMPPASLYEGRGERTIRFVVSTPRETSIQLLDRLGNRLAMGSNFLWLTYQDRNPQLAARTLNTWLDEYTRVAADLKKRNVVEFSNILQEQLRYAEKATQTAESTYQAFRVHTITLPTEAGPAAATAGGADASRDPALTSYFDQKIQYDNLRSDREALEKAIASASRGNSPYEGVLLIPSVAQSPGAEPLREAFRARYTLQARLAAERQNFTDEYPTVKELAKSLASLENERIPQLANGMLVQLKDRELDYERRIRGASRELQQIPPRTIEEMRLHRAVIVAEGLYTNLKARYSEAQLAEASATPDVSVLDTAIAPLTPTKNSAPMIILFAFGGGLAGAIGLALLLDAMDKRVRYAEQGTSELGLAFAGAVPKVPKGGISASSPEQVLQFVESFRSLRMHVSQSVPGDKVQLAVTSAAPADGKSLVSANLAMSFAEAGLKTLLIDGDTRRGALHRMFGGSAAIGLTEFLLGLADERAIVRETMHKNLAFISCGSRHRNSPELLSSPKLKQLIDQMSRSYHAVIVDTPPLAAGVDAYALSAAAGHMLMVIRIGQTERRLVATKLAIMDRLPVDIVGAVLNGVHTGGEFRYYSYASGYSIDSSEVPELASTTGSE